MAARAWLGRKPGPYRDALRYAQAMGRARRNPGRWVRCGSTAFVFDELTRTMGLR